MRKKAVSFVVSFMTVFVLVSSLNRAFADPLKLDVKEHVFKNGLKLLMLEKHDVPVVCVRI
ncbi:MAG TPA: M16 family metallopeptidase, partial [Candidatus Brocadiaceae bacterium]